MLAILAIFPVLTFAATINITTTDDTYYGTSYNKGPNNDLSSTLGYGGWGDNYYDFFHFDISSGPASANVSSVLLYVYDNAGSVNDAQEKAYRITSSWTASAVSSSNYPTYYSTAYNQMQTTTVTGWRTVDVTQLYKDWKNGTYTNYGIELRPAYNNNSNSSFSSLEGSYPPYLQITTIVPSGSLMSLGIGF